MATRFLSIDGLTFFLIKSCSNLFSAICCLDCNPRSPLISFTTLKTRLSTCFGVSGRKMVFFLPVNLSVTVIG